MKFSTNDPKSFLPIYSCLRFHAFLVFRPYVHVCVCVFANMFSCGWLALFFCFPYCCYCCCCFSSHASHIHNRSHSKFLADILSFIFISYICFHTKESCCLCHSWQSHHRSNSFSVSPFVKYFRYRMYLSCVIVWAAHIRSCDTCNSGSLSSIFLSPSPSSRFVVRQCQRQHECSAVYLSLSIYSMYFPFHNRVCILPILCTIHFSLSRWNLVLLLWFIVGFSRWSLLIELCYVCYFLCHQSHCIVMTVIADICSSQCLMSSLWNSRAFYTTGWCITKKQ